MVDTVNSTKARELLGVSRQTLYDWEKAGILSPLPRASQQTQKRYLYSDIMALTGDFKAKEQEKAIAATEVIHLTEALTQKHEGQFSDVFPAEIKDAFDEAGQDPNLPELIDDLKTTRAMLKVIMRQMRDGEPSAKMWKRLKELAREMTDAIRLADETSQRLILRELLKNIARGCPEAELRDEYVKLSKHRCELLELKIKQSGFASKYVTQEAAIARAMKEAELLKKHFGDRPEKLKEFAEEWGRLVLED